MTVRQGCLSLLAFSIAGGCLFSQSPEAQNARQELMASRSTLGLDGDHDFQIRRSHKDELNQTHTRMQQVFQGVRVWGGEVITHADAQGRKLSQTGDLTGAIRLFPKAVLTVAEALAIADTDLAPKGPYAYDPTAELVIYPVTSEVVKSERSLIPEANRNAVDYTRQLVRHALAYHVHTQLENGADETLHTDYMVDAHTGAILKKWNTLRDSAATGTGKSQYSGTVSINTNLNGSTYELSDVAGNMPIKTYDLNHKTSGTGTLYTDADNTWGDGANYSSSSTTTSANGQTAAVDAHYGIMMTSAFYKNVMSRNGIDGAGKATYSRVHYSSAYDNAYWDDTCFCMTYGDGSSFKSLEALDVAGHEMSHGVCANSANLNYSGESGGLNEANSDIFGTFVTYYAYGAGATGATVPTTIPSANLHGYTPWTIGSQLSSTPLRYMYKPSLDGSSPDAWSSSVGNLDVHYSSGPMNRCMFFLSQGATTSGNTSTTLLPSGMTGVGTDKAAHIWYRALTTYMTSTTNYAGARTACISAVKDLYGAGGAEEAAVWNAFHGINVGAAWTGTTTTTVAITPTTASVQPSATFQFTASVTGNTNTAVTWSVVEAAGGSVSTTGLYTAPTTAGTYHVKATSKGDTTVSATATVTVTAATVTTVTITPTSTTVQPSATFQFAAAVTGNTNTAVTWSVVETAGGSVSTTGLYTAPATAGTYHVKATSKGDTTASATATVTVTSGGTTTDLIVNGGFESGTTGWAGTTGDIGSYSGQTAYEGSAFAWIDGNGKTATETLYQTVTIPSTITSATLSFYLHIDTAETTTSTAYDKLTVTLQSSTGTVLSTLATYSNLNKVSGYVLRTFDVSAYKGQTVRVYFKGVEDSSLQTSFVLDKVSLIVK